MPVIAAIEIRPGEAAVAAADLAGRPVIERLLARLGRVEGLDGVVVVAAREEAGLLPPLEGAELLAIDLDDIARRATLLRARKWARRCWRGGIGNASWFDEFGSPINLERALDHAGCDHVLAVPVGAALIDTALAGEMVAHHVAHHQFFGFTFCQAPPGIAGGVYCRAYLQREIATGTSRKDLFAYDQTSPERDPIEFGWNVEIPDAIRYGAFRFSADSRRGLALMNGIYREVPGADEMTGPEAVRLLWERHDLRAGAFPQEVTIEPTGRRQLPGGALPRPPQARDGDLSIDLYMRVIDQLVAWDDLLLTLGGYGEPLLHPEIVTMIASARERGVYGIHLETDGILLDDEMIERLVEADPDLISVMIDADTAATYRALHGEDAFDRVLGNTERLVDAAHARKLPVLVCPTMTKVPENEGEGEAFGDRWRERGCWPVIRGFNHLAGQLEDRNPLPMVLAQRIPCRRQEDELVIYADGSVPICRQDVACGRVTGNVAETTIGDLWAAPERLALRGGHQRGDVSGFELCERCREWYCL